MQAKRRKPDGWIPCDGFFSPSERPYRDSLARMANRVGGPVPINADATDTADPYGLAMADRINNPRGVDVPKGHMPHWSEFVVIRKYAPRKRRADGTLTDVDIITEYRRPFNSETGTYAPWDVSPETLADALRTSVYASQAKGTTTRDRLTGSIGVSDADSCMANPNKGTDANSRPFYRAADRESYYTPEFHYPDDSHCMGWSENAYRDKPGIDTLAPIDPTGVSILTIPEHTLWAMALGMASKILKRSANATAPTSADSYRSLHRGMEHNVSPDQIGDMASDVYQTMQYELLAQFASGQILPDCIADIESAIIAKAAAKHARKGTGSFVPPVPFPKNPDGSYVVCWWSILYPLAYRLAKRDTTRFDRKADSEGRSAPHCNAMPDDARPFAATAGRYGENNPAAIVERMDWNAHKGVERLHDAIRFLGAAPTDTLSNAKGKNRKGKNHSKKGQRKTQEQIATLLNVHRNTVKNYAKRYAQNG